jgi:transcriptional regulator with XRE-family HTH domain
MPRIGERIRRKRRSRGWTQEDLAHRSGVKQPIISRLESQSRSNPTTMVLRSLARALDCSMDDLAGRYEDDDAHTHACSDVR